MEPELAFNVRDLAQSFGLPRRRGRTSRATSEAEGVVFHTKASCSVRSDALVTSSFLFLVVRPGATSSVLAPSSDALVTARFALL